MSTVHICLSDIFGVAVACEVIFYPGDTPFFNGSALAVSGARSIWLDAGGNGSVTLLPGHYTVRFSGITGNTDTLLILVPTEEGDYQLRDLRQTGTGGEPSEGYLEKAKNLSDVAVPATAFDAIKQVATPTTAGVAYIATQAEVDAGTDATKYVTPATLAQTFAAARAYMTKTAAFTAVAFGRYALDTTNGSFDVTIDAALPVGGAIKFYDPQGTWNTNPPSFLRGQHANIEGSPTNYRDSTQSTYLEIVNAGGAKGLRILENVTTPHNVIAPTISGNSVGAAILSTTGTWTGSPTSYSYQWQSSPDGITWNDISGATASTYTPGSDLVGSFVRVCVAATNANGTTFPAPSAASAAIEQLGFPSGATAFWNLDETSDVRVDATGNGNGLTDNNSVGSVAGMLGNAALFDGTNYLSGPNTLDFTGSFTVSTWARLDSLNGFQAILAKWARFQDKTYSLYTGIAGVGILSGIVSVDGSTDTVLDHPNPVAIGVWNHIAMVYDDAAKTLTLYLNNAPTTMPVEGPIRAGAPSVFLIGHDDDGTPFNGAVDLTGLWPRALSATEISQLYNNGNGAAYPV